jgi:hypothetical protein
MFSIDWEAEKKSCNKKDFSSHFFCLPDCLIVSLNQTTKAKEAWRQQLKIRYVG